MKGKMPKYLLVIFFLIIAATLSFGLYKGASYIYRNTNAHEMYKYSSKFYKDKVLDRNVIIEKDIKRNYEQGEIRLTFDKKNLNEEYEFTLGSELNPSSVEVSVIGKINTGDMNISLLNENNKELFNRTVSGLNIKEVSTSSTFAKSYKLTIISNNAKNGEVVIGFKFK